MIPSSKIYAGHMYLSMADQRHLVIPSSKIYAGHMYLSMAETPSDTLFLVGSAVICIPLPVFDSGKDRPPSCSLCSHTASWEITFCWRPRRSHDRMWHTLHSGTLLATFMSGLLPAHRDSPSRLPSHPTTHWHSGSNYHSVRIQSRIEHSCGWSLKGRGTREGERS